MFAALEATREREWRHVYENLTSGRWRLSLWVSKRQESSLLTVNEIK